MDRRADHLSSLLSGGGLPDALSHLSGLPMPAAAAHSDNFLGNQFQLPGAALPAAAPTDPTVAALLASLQSQQQQNPRAAALNQQQQQLAAPPPCRRSSSSRRRRSPRRSPRRSTCRCRSTGFRLPWRSAPAELAGIPGLPPPPAAAIAPAAIAPAAAARPSTRTTSPTCPGCRRPRPSNPPPSPSPTPPATLTPAPTPAPTAPTARAAAKATTPTTSPGCLVGRRRCASAAAAAAATAAAAAAGRWLLEGVSADVQGVVHRAAAQPRGKSGICESRDARHQPRRAEAESARCRAASDERPPRGKPPGFTPVLNGLSRLVGELGRGRSSTHSSMWCSIVR